MALEDVVQGVQVTVKTDGVDDAKSKIGQLDKAIGDLSKTAGAAAGGDSGGGPGGGPGIGGLNKAFSDLNTVSAQAFANIARSAATGDLTGLATMMGGPVAGSFVEAGRAIGQFIETQDGAILKNAAMAREFGTTPVAMQGIKEGFEGAGVSAQGFERLVNRMSRQVQNDYTDMTRNIRTDSDTQEGAVLRLQAAREKLAISKGADPKSFEWQDKLREQKQAQITVDQAEEGVRQQALKSIPHVTEMLKESIHTGQQNADITEVTTKTLRESIENMARVGEGPASPVDVLKKMAELTKSGAIDLDTSIKLLKEMGGMTRSAGLGGMDAVHEAEYFKKYGSSGITAAQSGKSAVAQAGLGTTEEDTKKATETISEWSNFTSLFGAAMKKIGASMSGNGSMLDTTLKGGEGMLKSLAEWHTRLQAMSDASTKARKAGGSTWDAMKAGFAAFDHPPETPEEQIDPKTGKKISQPTRKTVGSGPAEIITIPDDWIGKNERAKAGVEETSGTARVIHVPKDDEALPKGGIGETTSDARFLHMSVTDDANAPWRGLRGEGAAPAAASAPVPSPPGRGYDNEINGAIGGIVNAITNAFHAPAGGGPASWHAEGPQTGTAAPAAPPVVNITPPVVNITINAIPGTTATATAAPGTATPGPTGHWEGGAINIPGFADGGGYDYSGNMGGMSRDQMAADIAKHPDRLGAYWNPIKQAYQPRAFGMQSDFADGGPMSALLNYGIKVGSGVWNSIQASAPKSGDEARDMLFEHIRSHAVKGWAEHGIESGLEAAGLEGTAAVAGAAFGILSNPFHSGLLDASPTGAADYNAGAGAEEASGRAMGAHNLKEADEARKQRSAMIFGDTIPGFAGGGLSGETDDPIEHAEIIVADAELEVARNPGASGPKERLALAKNALAKVQAEAHREERDRKVWQEGQGQRDRANEYSRKLNAAEKKFREEPGDHGVFHREEYGLWGGGSIPGFATGSIKGPGTGTSDSILARLSNGEFVMKDAAVRTYGEGFMHAINNMQIPPPKYEHGGMVPASSLPRFAEGGGMERPGSILNLHVGGEVFSGLKAPAAVADQLRKFAINQQTTQTGQKPSWA